MATLAQLEAQLEKINLAIDAVESGGQDYKINDGLIETWVRRGDLGVLYQERVRLEKRISRISDSGGFIAI